jgi:hypothetical protein
MNPFTATLNILLVVALYSVLRIVFPDGSGALVSCDDDAGTVEKDRRTRGESSSSTRKDCRAADARRALGRGTSMVLLTCLGQYISSLPGEEAYREQGNLESRCGVIFWY